MRKKRRVSSLNCVRRIPSRIEDGADSTGQKGEGRGTEAFLGRAETRLRANGTPDDLELLKLAKDPLKLRPTEKTIVLGCLNAQIGPKPGGKLVGPRIEPAADQVPIGLLRSTNLPAFKELPDDPSKGLPESNRHALMKVLPQIYLLTPPEKPLDMDKLLKRLDISWEWRPKPPDPAPVYLLQQLAL